MAREMYLVGVSKEELQPPPPPQKPQTPKGKWENYWYHYKWVTIGVATAVLLVIIMTVQMLTREKYDYHMVIVTDEMMSAKAVEMMESVIEFSGEDLDENGEVNAIVENLVITDDYTQYQITAANRMKLMAYYTAADYVLFAYTPDRWKELMDAADGIAFFADLSLGDTAGWNQAGCYWDWKGSALQKSDVMSGMPESLYFGVRDIRDRGEKRAELTEQSIRMLQKFVRDAMDTE